MPSDDYYDEDPALLKQNPQDGSSPRKRPIRRTEVSSKGKKRKLADIEDIPIIDLGERRTLENCVLGTVWAKSPAQPDMPYREGEGEKVALLKNWKAVFNEFKGDGKHVQRTFGKGQLRRDESWANDMSLEDMGLRSAKGRDLSDAAQATEQETYAEDEEVELFDEEMEPPSPGLDPKVDLFDQQEETETPPRKRQRKMVPPSPPPSKESCSTDLQVSSNEDRHKEEGQGTVNRTSRGRPRRQNATGDSGADPTIQTKSQPQRHRKRRASDLDNESDNQQEISPTDEHPSKRIAPNKSSTEPQKKEERSLPLATTRVTRSRKQ